MGDQNKKNLTDGTKQPPVIPTEDAGPRAKRKDDGRELMTSRDDLPNLAGSGTDNQWKARFRPSEEHPQEELVTTDVTKSISEALEDDEPLTDNVGDDTRQNLIALSREVLIPGDPSLDMEDPGEGAVEVREHHVPSADELMAALEADVCRDPEDDPNLLSPQELTHSGDEALEEEVREVIRLYDDRDAASNIVRFEDAWGKPQEDPELDNRATAPQTFPAIQRRQSERTSFDSAETQEVPVLQPQEGSMSEEKPVTEDIQPPADEANIRSTDPGWPPQQTPPPPPPASPEDAGEEEEDLAADLMSSRRIPTGERKVRATVPAVVLEAETNWREGVSVPSPYAKKDLPPLRYDEEGYEIVEEITGDEGADIPQFEIQEHPLSSEGAPPSLTGSGDPEPSTPPGVTVPHRMVTEGEIDPEVTPPLEEAEQALHRIDQGTGQRTPTPTPIPQAWKGEATVKPSRPKKDPPADPPLEELVRTTNTQLGTSTLVSAAASDMAVNGIVRDPVDSDALVSVLAGELERNPNPPLTTKTPALPLPNQHRSPEDVMNSGKKTVQMRTPETEPRKDEKGPSGWIIALGLIVFTLLVGGIAAYFITNGDEVPQQTVASLQQNDEKETPEEVLTPPVSDDKEEVVEDAEEDEMVFEETDSPSSSTPAAINDSQPEEEEPAPKKTSCTFNIQDGHPVKGMPIRGKTWYLYHCPNGEVPFRFFQVEELTYEGSDEVRWRPHGKPRAMTPQERRFLRDNLKLFAPEK